MKLEPNKALFLFAETADTPGWGPKYYTTPATNLSRENLKIFLKNIFHKTIDKLQSWWYTIIKVRETKQNSRYS